MTALYTYFYIVVDTQWGCHTLKKRCGCCAVMATTVMFTFNEITGS